MLIFLRSRIYEAVEFLKVKRRYYGDAHFKKVDQTILHSCDPFSISKKYLMEKGDDPYQYGETPLTTLDKIAKEFKIGAHDQVIEMGSGRGRCAFFLSYFYKCKVVGIEQIGDFVELGNAIVRVYKLPKLKFVEANMLDMNVSSATYLYLYQSMLSDSDIDLLCEKLSDASKKLKVITVSYPLQDYDSRYRVEKVIRGEFLFGKTEVYLNTRREL
ncbi:MAG: class I SAM-dependent methyltransferase [Rhabdochlamydiaceae bacterium]|nr:class I SAM-dependent methyltransferase [Candidatus Amphrikana amoebophyrae]